MQRDYSYTLHSHVHRGVTIPASLLRLTRHLPILIGSERRSTVYGAGDSELGFTLDGPHAEYYLIPGEILAKKPTRLSRIQQPLLVFHSPWHEDAYNQVALTRKTRCWCLGLQTQSRWPRPWDASVSYERLAIQRIRRGD